MRCSQSDRVRGLETGDAGGLERSMSLLLCSSSSSSLQSAPDRRSLIGNEPWRHRPSRHQQIATAYRLWRGNSSPPLLFLHRSSFAPSLSLSLFISHSQCLWGPYDLSEAVSRSWAQRVVFYCSWSVTHPTYYIPAGLDIPPLTYSPDLATFHTLLVCNCLLPCKWTVLKESHLQRTTMLEWIDFQ